MDSSKDPSTSSNRHHIKPLPRLQASRSSNSSTDGNLRGEAHGGNTLRRGHSDGDVSSNGSRLHHQNLGNNTLRGGETWMDFLRSSDAGSLSEEQAQIATRNVAADRKRRYTGQQEEHSRRRSTSNLSFGQPSSETMRQGLSLSTTVDPVPAIPRSSLNRPGHRITDRPLPPRPGAANSPRNHSRDITLPAWQPDAEVSDCPICGQHFTFWYRKHHCRKCGRVVCASCSPHRITIPRQFIVHPPSGPDELFGPGIPPAAAVVDLTGDDDDEVTELHNTLDTNRWHNQENRVDSALGGGQEVRLCNPCVPDPNPSPHLPFTPPSRYDSFSTPEDSVRVARHHPEQNRSNSNNPQRLGLPHGNGSGHLLYHPRNTAAADHSPERQPTGSPLAGSSTSARRQSRTSRLPDLSPHFTPNYSLRYGSAPDPSFHEVRLKLREASIYRPNELKQYLSSLLQQHPSSRHRHRHHASAGHVSGPSRPPSMLVVDGPPPSREVPQPVIREEDECPICHGALPPKGPGGCEVAREAHVVFCIESHLLGPTPQVPRLPATGNIVAAAGATPTRASERTSTINRYSSNSASETLTSFFMPRRRTTGMIVYLASEKDCVGEDGEGPQECVICFEEFAVGDEMGRLECLCKFHKVNHLISS